MKEELLHFIWKYRLLTPSDYKSVNGTRVKILQPGELNTDAGPDFFNSRLEVGGVTLAGNVEIHVRSSDWIKHKHQSDTAYNNLILHAVYQHDKPIAQNEDFNVEILELKNYISKSVLEKYEHLVSSKAVLPCSSRINSVSELKLSAWLQRMLIERLEYKILHIKDIFEASQHDYAQCFYTLLARNFGFKVNAEPFSLLARHLPLNILLKHKDNVLQLEALLFGTAGLLNESFKDKYLQQLQNEFEFLSAKYKLVPFEKKLWKFSRMRPANFPSVRLWQFASLIHHCPDIFLSPLTYKDADLLKKAISHPPSNYWKEHYKPGGARVKNIGPLGENSIHTIIINTMAPFLFFYGRQNGKDEYTDAALEIFDTLPFEENAKTRVFTKTGLSFGTGGESQSLINLYDNYCKEKKCLKCAIASEILSAH